MGGAAVAECGYICRSFTIILSRYLFIYCLLNLFIIESILLSEKCLNEIFDGRGARAFPRNPVSEILESPLG